MSTKILVAGAGGYIGGHVARRLRNEGHDLRCVGVKPVDERRHHVDDVERVVRDLSRHEDCASAARR